MTALSPVTGTSLKLAFVTGDEFDRVVDPAKMVRPYLSRPSGLFLPGFVPTDPKFHEFAIYKPRGDSNGGQQKQWDHRHTE